MAEPFNKSLASPEAAYACNGQPISSAAFYAIACDPRRSVAVEACAGAGKTWMLVSRMVRALLESASREPAPNESANGPVTLESPSLGVQPQEILAITFTRKAASEMRQRLEEWLEKFAHASDADLLHELHIRGVPIGEALGSLEKPFFGHQNRLQPNKHLHKQLSNLYRQMLASGRSVQIQTFHGWFAALLRGAPVAVLQRLGLPLQYQLLDSDEQACQQVWRPFYAFLVGESGVELGAGSAEESDATKHNPATLKADFQALVRIHGRSNARKALEAVLGKRTEFSLADEAGVVAASVRPFGEIFPAFAGLDRPVDALASPACRIFWLEVAQSLGQEKNTTPRKAATAIEEAFALADLPQRLLALQRAIFVLKENRLHKNLESFGAANQAASVLLELCQASAQHEAWLHQQRMARLARALIAHYAALKRSNGWVDMNDVERAAFALLSDPVLSGWVQERLDARIRHLLIDEFQDTNPLQWQALSSWLAGYVGAASRPSVFLVGDPKQSIYRFRRAEPQVLIAAQRFVVEGLGGDLLSCDHTWRNAGAVIGAVNAVMSSTQASGAYTGFRPHTSASMQAGKAYWLPQVPRRLPHAKTPGETPVWRDSLHTPRDIPEETLRTLEAQQAARWIAGQIATGTKAGEVMVLARKRAGLLPMQQALQTLHIAAVVGEKTQLIDCCEVQDIVALLDVLMSAPHDLSLARALRSPLFDVPESALVALALLQQTHQRPWLELLLEPELLPPEIPAMKAVSPVLLRWKAWLDQLPPHDALQRIYDDGDVLARFAAAVPAVQRSRVLGNLRALLEVALNMASGGRYATPYALVRLLKSGSAEATPATARDAVQLLTVHTAKGLEATTVLLLDTDGEAPRTPGMDMLIDWPGEQSVPQRFVFIASEKYPPLCAVDTLAAEQLARQREESNALYVAMTRAKVTLAVSSIAPLRANPGSWWQRLLAHLPPFAFEIASETAPTHAPVNAPANATAVQENLVFDADAETGAVPNTFLLAQLPAWQQPKNPARAASPALSCAALADSDGEDESSERVEAKVEADALNTRIGQAMHRLLEWGVVPQTLPNEAANVPFSAPVSSALFAPQQINAVGREFRLAPQQAQRAAQMAQTILHGAAAWAWQSDALAWQGNEVALVYQGRVLRIDRLVQRADHGHSGHWWVLDYKSALTPESQPALVAQLAHYRRAVQSAYPDALVKAAFLTGNGRVVELDDD